jgi:hypothetical protein
MFVPTVPELKIGRAYFCCGYLLERLPVPGIETWIYLGTNIYDEDQASNIRYHYFERPDVYFSAQIAEENKRFVRHSSGEEEIASDAESRMRVSEHDLEGLVYDYAALRDWVNHLEDEPNANKVF